MSEPNITRKKDKSQDKPNRIPNSGDNSHKTKTIIKRIITFLSNKNNQTLISNCVSIGMLIVTAVLAWYTFKLFEQATTQTAASAKSANAAAASVTIAQQTFIADTIYNNKSIKSQVVAIRKAHIADSIKAIKDSLTFDLQKQGLQGQIASLIETRKDFEKENQPYLVAKELQNPIFKAGSIVSFDYSLFNYGKQPVKIIKMGSTLEFVPKQDSVSFLKNPFSYLTNWQDVSEYVANGYPRKEFFKQKELMSSSTEYAFYNGIYTIYLIGRCDYINNINEKERRYDYLIKISYTKEYGELWSFIYNENYDIK
ncbi:hypothetical protein HDF18_15935 [Mucilaginibacter sp. X5P1]|uniref:hypothetical protein n=1 Tax=Mucilaginibacter sp. X5P1 TaxID=2723088 RepID=UPI001622FF97|nr:hypothetical protein [Mucilaginibacter sp. X5P1]MBB6139113.1 hypothetical protein [Mucilaginibacter sp. X5P1]